jgi:hypothetical protein
MFDLNKAADHEAARQVLIVIVIVIASAIPLPLPLGNEWLGEGERCM